MNFSKEIFEERYAQARTALATGVDFTEWQLEWVPEQEAIELERQRAGKSYHLDVNTLLLCCPGDHRCEESCKSDRKLCRLCELPVCYDCQLCLLQKYMSPIGLMNENFIGFLDPWIYETDITWMEQLWRLRSGPA